ncbi:hypothetical protein [Pseudomonas sp. NPDC089569]|uniref:hypothetical protein n=1 Tax=Pseudomonas sp. NPDC089569 TaxID=3390722 RepID=UPI003D06C595
MEEEQFLRWLKSRHANCAPGDPENIVAEMKRTGRCKWKDKSGRDYKAVFQSIHGLFIVEY